MMIIAIGSIYRAQLQFSFEATQWNGLTIKKDHTDKDGYVKENEKAHSEDKN